MYVCVIKTPISHNKMENQVDKLKLEEKYKLRV